MRKKKSKNNRDFKLTRYRVILLDNSYNEGEEVHDAM